jgi:hypothetical protein
MSDKLLARIGIGIFIVIMGVIFIPNMVLRFSVEQAVTGLLDNVIDSNYEEAFEHVFYFDRATDLKPTITFEEAKEQWITRVKNLKDQGVYIKDYRNLKVWEDDGATKGTVSLVIIKNGEKITRESVHLWFSKQNGDWKVGSFEHLSNDVHEEWEKALSGKVPTN